jgi:hypothetical protein
MKSHETFPSDTNNKKFWKELAAYFPLIWYEQHRKRNLQQFVAVGTFLPNSHLTTIGRYIRHASNNSSVVACIRCRGNVFTMQLPSNEMRDTRTCTDTQTDGKDLWYTPFLDMYHPEFQKLWSNLIESRRLEHEDTRQQHPEADGS